MTTATYLVGDVFDRLAEIPDGTIDLVMTSPPFYRLRSYLPDDHPDKGKEIGSEPTPAEYLDTMLALTAEWGRVLAPHGSICVELGDTYAGSGGAGGDYNEDGLRDGQQRFNGSARAHADVPPDKSLLFIPSLYAGSLAYGRNLLTGAESPAGRWRVRNLVAWVRPNPPVGALGDKFRPATSYLTIACRARDRYFDLEAVRTAPTARPQRFLSHDYGRGGNPDTFDKRPPETEPTNRAHPAGAPPLDWWNIPPSGYPGAHYAVYPPELCTRPILTMTPRRVCTTCGQPSRRLGQNAGFGRQPELAAHIKERREALGLTSSEVNGWFGYKEIAKNWERIDPFGAAIPNAKDWPLLKERLGLSDDFDDFVLSRDRSVVEYDGIEDGTPRRGDYGRGGHAEVNHTQTTRRVVDRWSDCGHSTWRPGHVLDPFAGTGTTIAVATGHARAATGIDLDPRNADLALERVGMFLTVDTGTRQETA